MEDCPNKLQITEKRRSSSFFTRSLTLYSASMESTTLSRAGSLKKLYNSVESLFSATDPNSIKGKVKKLCSIFETTKTTSEETDTQPSSKPKPTKSMVPEDRIVLYFTSLRGVRRTYEDCYAVRMIFRGFRLWVDERDISMDSGYKNELQTLLGEKKKQQQLGLPQIFISGNYVGGAEEIKHMFENGELAKLVNGLAIREAVFCESCGDMRFVPCSNCSGSRKLFDEDQGMLKRCVDCNENGLIRCPNCCS